MKAVRRGFFVVALTFLLGGCCSAPRNTVTQVSTFGALLAGAYDGQMTCRELSRHGNLGIGTFHRLDGEMVLLDGKVTQIKADGKACRPPPDATTPFACVVKFDPEEILFLNSPVDRAALEKAIDTAAPGMNLFTAIKTTGRFTSVKVRSVPAQSKPYPPLPEVTKNQPVFTYTNIVGTLVGFRLPAYTKGINVPGYHLHFLSADESVGGHVIEFTMENGTVELDICNRFFMVLPGKDSEFSRIDLSGDRTQETEKTEK